MTALLITTYNRPQYLEQCLESVAASDLSRLDFVIIIDDASGDYQTRKLVDEFALAIPVYKYTWSANVGIKMSLQKGYELAFKKGAETVVNLDGDAVVSKDWLNVLFDLKLRHPMRIVSGFNSVTQNKDGSLRNQIIADFPDMSFKKHANGINMVVSKGEYHKHIAPALNKPGNWDFNATHNVPFVIAKPSVVQHIGIKSSMGHEMPDTAIDFGCHLPDVTLLGIDAHDQDGMKRAAMISQLHFTFGHIEIITDRVFYGREAYSQYFIEMLPRHIKTSHVLIIHPDGYIVNPKAWRDEWLQWDYIGALWVWKGSNRNGNGGFSLRSKRLHEILAEMARSGEMNDCHPEDERIADMRHILESKYGMRFAPDEVCEQFSIEAWEREDKSYKGSFGFHGYNIEGLPYGLEPTTKK